MSQSLTCENYFNRQAEQLKKIMFSKLPITNEEWEEFKSTLVLKTARKNRLLLSPDKKEYCARLILKGIVKITHHEPVPYVFDFRKKGCFLCNVVSLTGKIKSDFSFETITDCEWIETNSDNIIGLNDKVLHAFSSLVIEYMNRGHERASFLRIGNAEERYTRFCSLHPDVIRYAKQADIASFLDITTQSLSRIRKKLLKKFND